MKLQEADWTFGTVTFDLLNKQRVIAAVSVWTAVKVFKVWDSLSKVDVFSLKSAAWGVCCWCHHTDWSESRPPPFPTGGPEQAGKKKKNPRHTSHSLTVTSQQRTARFFVGRGYGIFWSCLQTWNDLDFLEWRWSLVKKAKQTTEEFRQRDNCCDSVMHL